MTNRENWLYKCRTRWVTPLKRVKLIFEMMVDIDAEYAYSMFSFDHAHRMVINTRDNIFVIHHEKSNSIIRWSDNGNGMKSAIDKVMQKINQEKVDYHNVLKVIGQFNRLEPIERATLQSKYFKDIVYLSKEDVTTEFGIDDEEWKWVVKSAHEKMIEYLYCDSYGWMNENDTPLTLLPIDTIFQRRKKRTGIYGGYH